MKRELLHTPEGVRDIYSEECQQKQFLKERLRTAIECFGYHIIQTPVFEFFDIFGKEIGTTPSKELYKFFDRDGNTLVLRPDITPSIARAAAKYFMGEDMPIRLYYSGSTFINHTSYQGRLKESTQLGAELIGDNSVDADAEMIAMAIECLKTSGLTEFQLSVGHSDFFQGLSDAAGLDEDTQKELRELIANKNYFGVEEVITHWKMDDDLRQLFQMLGNLYSSMEEMQKARALAVNYPRILTAVIRLEELHKVLEVYGIDKFISYELGMVNNYQYYTGIIFAGYTFGSGEPILKGGRYDKLLGHFGKDAPSIGFALVVDQLMAALGRQQIPISIPSLGELIVYTKANQKKAVEKAMELRGKGISVELLSFDSSRTKEEYEAYWKRNGKNKITYMDGE